MWGGTAGTIALSPSIDSIPNNMKTISLSVLKSDYEAYKRAAAEKGRSVAQLIREAMALYRAEKLEQRPPLVDLPVFPGHRPCGELPSRDEVWEEMFDGGSEH